MPRVNWGVSAKDIDGFDRESQFRPYAGPIPPSGVYQWKVKKLQSVAGTREKNPQMRIGLELVPRNRDEKRFNNYFIMDFVPVTQKTEFRYVPFLDAIGVTSTEFTGKTLTDEEGNIKKIGSWRNDGETLILASLKDDVDQNGAPRKAIGTYMEIPGDQDSDEDEAGDYEDDDYRDLDYGDEEAGDYDEDDDF